MLCDCAKLSVCLYSFDVVHSPTMLIPYIMRKISQSNRNSNAPSVNFKQILIIEFEGKTNVEIAAHIYIYYIVTFRVLRLIQLKAYKAALCRFYTEIKKNRVRYLSNNKNRFKASKLECAIFFCRHPNTHTQIALVFLCFPCSL